MQSNIFVKVVPLLREKKFNINYEETLQFLGRYKSQDLIYPSALNRNLKLDIRTVYDVLEICVDVNLIERILEIYCPYCNKYANQWFKTVADLPEEIYCPHCDHEITNPIEHSIVIYKVI